MSRSRSTMRPERRAPTESCLPRNRSHEPTASNRHLSLPIRLEPACLAGDTVSCLLCRFALDATGCEGDR